MSTELILADGLVGVIDYTLKNADGEVLDTSEGRGPMPYLHGASNIIPGLENALEAFEERKTIGRTVVEL